jgi:hypothetical protein
MFTGRCLCGAVHFEIHGTLGRFAYCHCTSCRRASGSAFTANAPVLAAEVKWTSGRESIREYESSPGKFRAFCSRCGSPIYARLVAQPEWLSIRLGLIDADPGHRAQAHFNVASKAAWFTVSDDLPQYPGDTETDSPEP